MICASSPSIASGKAGETLSSFYGPAEIDLPPTTYLTPEERHLLEAGLRLAVLCAAVFFIGICFGVAVMGVL